MILTLSTRARKDVVLSLSHPIQGVDGTTLNEILIPKGTPIVVGIRSCNRSKAIWGNDALEWKPERWLSPLPTTLDDAHVPGVYAHLSVISSCNPYLMTPIDETRACF